MSHILEAIPGQGDVAVQGDGKQIVLDFPNLGEALMLLKPWSGRKRRAEMVERLHTALKVTGLSLEIRVNGTPIARLGPGPRTGLALRILGLDGAV
jgi:hypothetical protein